MSWDVVGHTWAVELLRSQIAGERLRHAYLITGPQGVGRRTLALSLARAINCLEPPAPGDFCGICRNCRQISSQAHPDLAVVEAETVGATLKVDQVRSLQHMLALAPYAAAYRVALLLRFEEAHISAANALLKTLEEPSPRVVLILTADSPENVPETILSRCQLLRLRPMSVEALAEDLHRRWQISAAEARLLAHLSGGRPGMALRLHDDSEELARRSAWLDSHREMVYAGRVARFAFAGQAAGDRGELRSMLETWATYWRDVLIASSGATSPLTNIDRQEEIQQVAGRIRLEQAHAALRRIEETRDSIDQNANLRLAAETLLLALPRL